MEHVISTKLYSRLMIPPLDFHDLFQVLLRCRGIYGRITPCNEPKLIREGKIAPAVSPGGALLGFVLPLASVIY